MRQLYPADVTDAYVGWLNDFETTKYLEVRFHPQTRETVEAYVKSKLLPGSMTWHLGVFDEEGTRLVGTVTFNHVDVHHLSAGISFVIGHPEAKGRGYATEAVHAATHHMFAVEGFVKIYGGYYADHRSSEAVFLKNGYLLEGRLRKRLVNYRNERVDHVWMGILRDEFRPDRKYLG